MTLAKSFPVSVFSARSAVEKSFLTVVIIRLFPFHDDLFQSFDRNRPLTAVRIVTTIPARIIGDDVINEIFIAGVAKLMRLARSEEKRVPCPHLGGSILVANIAAPGDDEIKFRLRRV